MRKIILIALLFAAAALTANAQVYTLNAAVDGSGSNTATVTNTGTGVLMIKAPSKGPGTSTAVQIVATETSGTTAGTITLLGSNDGVNWKAATIAEASTALTTYTATDLASQTFIWRLTGAPYLYYQVSWTGSGTMVDTFTATIYVH